MDNFKLPEYHEIPDVGLFLEQVQRYVAGYLDPLPKTSLTTSMISNYVKHSIIAKPVKKQYYREQIAEIFFVAIAKSILSLDDIRFLIELSRKNSDVEIAYGCFKSELTLRLSAISASETETSEGKPGEKASGDSEENAALLRELCTGIAYKLHLDDALGRMQEYKADAGERRLNP